MEQVDYNHRTSFRILLDGIYEGRYFYICQNGGYPVAYVQLKSGESDDMDKCDHIRVHGGVTYLDKLSWDTNNSKYLGWDYVHAGDCIRMATSLGWSEGKRWTTEEIYEEVKSVIAQLNGD